MRELTEKQKEALQALLNRLSARADVNFVKNLLVTGQYRRHTYKPSARCVAAVDHVLGKRPTGSGR